MLTLWENAVQSFLVTIKFIVKMPPESHPNKRARRLGCLLIISCPLSWVEGMLVLPEIQVTSLPAESQEHLGSSLQLMKENV